VTVDRHDDLAGVDVLLGGSARQQYRFADRLPERRHPQVALELGQWLGKRLGDRSRPVHGPAGHAADLGGDRSRLQ
jgi:hypothetical protein